MVNKLDTKELKVNKSPKAFTRELPIGTDVVHLDVYKQKERGEQEHNWGDKPQDDRYLSVLQSLVEALPPRTESNIQGNVMPMNMQRGHDGMGRGSGRVEATMGEAMAREETMGTTFFGCFRYANDGQLTKALYTSKSSHGDLYSQSPNNSPSDSPPPLESSPYGPARSIANHQVQCPKDGRLCH